MDLTPPEALDSSLHRLRRFMMLSVLECDRFKVSGLWVAEVGKVGQGFLDARRANM